MEYALTNDAAKCAVLTSSKPGSFIAGADIAWLDSAKDADEVSTNKINESWFKAV